MMQFHSGPRWGELALGVLDNGSPFVHLQTGDPRTGDAELDAMVMTKRSELSVSSQNHRVAITATDTTSSIEGSGPPAFTLGTPKPPDAPRPKPPTEAPPPPQPK
jgi:hypothetical protein